MKERRSQRSISGIEKPAARSNLSRSAGMLCTEAWVTHAGVNTKSSSRIKIKVVAMGMRQVSPSARTSLSFPSQHTNIRRDGTVDGTHGQTIFRIEKEGLHCSSFKDRAEHPTTAAKEGGSDGTNRKKGVDGSSTKPWATLKWAK